MIDNEVEVRWSTNEPKIGRRWTMRSVNKMKKFESKRRPQDMSWRSLSRPFAVASR